MVFPAVELHRRSRSAAGRYVTGIPQNWGRFSEPAIDDLFSRQARTLDPAERRGWSSSSRRSCWTRVPHARSLVVAQRRALAKVKNWVAPPSHFTNQKLQDVWLSED
jgi:hypothetical protein